MIDKHLDGIEQRQLAAGGENGLVHAVVRPKIFCMALDDRLPHVGNARHHGVAGEIRVNGGDRRVLDVARGREVRFPGAEIHQVGALGAQFGCLGGHGHGR